MRTQKLLLPFAGTTVIEHIVRELMASRVTEVVVVTGHEPERIKRRLENEEVTFAHNDKYEEGMLSSVRAGLSAAPRDPDAYLIVLGDQPLMRSEIVDAVVDSARANPDRLIVPVYEGRRGHPLAIPARHKNEIMTSFDEVGLRGLIHAHEEEVLELAVNSDNVLHDMDYPEDYQAALKKFNAQS